MIAPEVAERIARKARLRSLLTVASGLACGLALAPDALEPAVLEAICDLAAGTARRAAAARAPAGLRVGTAPLEYVQARAELELAPKLGCLDALVVESAGAPLAALVFGPPPPWYATGCDVAAGDPLALALSAGEAAAGLPVLFVPSCAAARDEVAAGATANQARDAAHLTAALMQATADAGSLLLPFVELSQQSVGCRTAVLPERSAVSRALERAEVAAEVGAVSGRADAAERVGWLRRLESAACEGRTAWLEVPAARLRLGSLEVLALGAELEPEVALRLAQSQASDLVVTAAGVQGRRAVVAAQPGQARLEAPGTLEPLCDLWPLAAGAAAQLEDALE